jgi:hypothetical protein
VTRSAGSLGEMSHALSAEEKAQVDLPEEQRQIFEKDNQDMLKHYESTLDNHLPSPPLSPKSF